MFYEYGQGKTHKNCECAVHTLVDNCTGQDVLVPLVSENNQTYSKNNFNYFILFTNILY